MKDDFDDLFGSWVFLEDYARRIVAVTDLADATELARNIYLAGVETHHRVASQEIAELHQKLAEVQRKPAGS